MQNLSPGSSGDRLWQTIPRWTRLFTAVWNVPRIWKPGTTLGKMVPGPLMPFSVLLVVNSSLTANTKISLLIYIRRLTFNVHFDWNLMDLHVQYMYKILAFCYRKYRKCSECCYATNCHAAFTNHRKEYHSTRRTCRQTSNKRERTPQFYCLCICGFVSSSGNKTGSLGLFCSNKWMHILISVMISKYFHFLTLNWFEHILLHDLFALIK